ncbi:hypothetical protein Riv7116_2974 [Rivularia sp. PCC 7116]|uniref:formylglycine-generating enzyme family protein n=1 Tax=Rivularia sp. PCC 7116 TaxID=373994 RepID=UPI00029F2FE6|nr:formylglycine-generating enzyme family protein [Rivularia sp. PCC 7116]AFY55455.1 hypothetical protein Riv7116_2974 [Rivularia sp. PCC 7116]
MIEKVLEILENAGFNFTARELVDIFWLAIHLDEEKPDSTPQKHQREKIQDSHRRRYRLPIKQDSTPEHQQVNKLEKQKSIQKSQPAIQNPPPSLPVALPSVHKFISEAEPNLNIPVRKSVSLKVPAAPALRNTLELGRALRPLMRKVPSLTNQILDEEATVKQIAEQDIWVPVFAPKPQRWLELALVVEKSNSTVIWEPTIRELQKLLKHHGAFRDVRTWELKVTPTASELFPLKLCSQGSLKQNYRNDINSTPYTPDILIDPKERRLILLVTDCISPAWRNKFIHPTLKLWGNKGLLTILQLLPEELWERTALSAATPVYLSSLKPGVPNSQLLTTIWDEDEIENDNSSESISIPIVTLEPQPLLTWSQVIAGFGNITTAGFKFSLPELRSQTKINPKPSQLTPDTIVNRFRATASPTARRLAGLMAAAPVSLPVVQLIQKTLLPDSRQIHIAEVFMSGLLKSTTIKDNPDYIEYEFLPGVRKLLVDSVPKSKAISVIDAVSEYISEKLGLSVQQFEARLLLPAYEHDNLAIKIRPFAKIKAEVFRRLGGIYAHIAEDLENNSLQALEDFPPLQTLEYEVATISIKHDHKHTINLKNFIFEVATIEINKSKYTTEIVIHRQQQQNQYFAENLDNLDNKIQLEMVQIPDGTFLMGAPRGEDYTMHNEFPQHQVTVPTFFMSKYPITQAQWQAVANLPQVSREMKLEPSYFRGDNLPVEQISWYDAVEFCARLSNHTQKEYRLPSEAEWEYACRAGTFTPFHFGETITSDLANYNALEIYATEKQGENRRHTTEVGHFAVANAFGLYDMHGNVWEWCIDDWHNGYDDAPIDSTAWLRRFEHNNKHSGKVLRGGSWFDVPEECRSACRSTYFPGYEYYFFGFRVVCNI